MTILVATPYLDEAERCHRVALMHDGRIHRTGTPAELRQGLGLQRLEVQGRRPELGSDRAGGRNGVADVQRFGDRLDVMVGDAGTGERAVRGGAGGGPHRSSRGAPGARPPSRTRSWPSRGRGGCASPTRWSSRPVRGPRLGHRRCRPPEGVRRLPGGQERNLDVRYGEIYGLLGANGACKTTTIKMLCGLSSPSSGTVQLVGQSGRRLRSAEVRFGRSAT